MKGVSCMFIFVLCLIFSGYIFCAIWESWDLIYSRLQFFSRGSLFLVKLLCSRNLLQTDQIFQSRNRMAFENCIYAYKHITLGQVGFWPWLRGVESSNPLPAILEARPWDPAQLNWAPASGRWDWSLILWARYWVLKKNAYKQMYGFFFLNCWT